MNGWMVRRLSVRDKDYEISKIHSMPAQRCSLIEFFYRDKNI